MAITFLTNEDRNELESEISKIQISGSSMSQSLRNAIYNLLMDAAYQSSDHTADKEVLSELLTGESSGGGEEVTYYTIEKTLTNVSIDNGAASIAAGSAYSATLTADEGYTLDSVSVTMGDEEVTVTDGVIDITSVTGNIVITATAIAESTGGYEWQSGVAYDLTDKMIEGYKLDSYGNEVASEGSSCTDFLNCFDADYIVHTQSSIAIHFYDINKKWICNDYQGSSANPVCHIVPANAVYVRANGSIKLRPVKKEINITPGEQTITYSKGIMEDGENTGSGSMYTSNELIPIGGAIAANRASSRVAVYDAYKNYIFQISSPTDFDDLNGVKWGGFSYMKICDWSNNTPFVLFDSAAHTVTKTLSNATCTGYNYANDGHAYTATVAASDGYVLSTVSVTMGGVDITETVYADGVITIPSANGEIVITATAEAIETE